MVRRSSPQCGSMLNAPDNSVKVGRAARKHEIPRTEARLGCNFANALALVGTCSRWLCRNAWRSVGDREPRTFREEKIGFSDPLLTGRELHVGGKVCSA